MFSAAGKWGNKIRDISSVTCFLAELKARRWLTKSERNIPEAFKKKRKEKKREDEEETVRDVMEGRSKHSSVSLAVTRCEHFFETKGRQRQRMRLAVLSVPAMSLFHVSKPRHTSYPHTLNPCWNQTDKWRTQWSTAGCATTQPGPKKALMKGAITDTCPPF